MDYLDATEVIYMRDLRIDNERPSNISAIWCVLEVQSLRIQDLRLELLYALLMD